MKRFETVSITIATNSDVTSCNKIPSATTPNPCGTWDKGWDTGEDAEERNSHVCGSKTTREEGNVSLAEVQYAEAILREEDSTSSARTCTIAKYSVSSFPIFNWREAHQNSSFLQPC
jgi:hypothetical protein